MNLTDPCVWNRFPWSILGSPCVNISITHCVVPKASAIRKACASVNMEQPMHMVSFTGAYRDSRLAGLSLWRWAEVNDQVIPRSCLAGACHDLCNFRLVPIFDLCWFPKTAGNESAYVNPNFEESLRLKINTGSVWQGFLYRFGWHHPATIQQLDVNGLIAGALRVCNICDGCVSAHLMFLNSSSDLFDRDRLTFCLPHEGCI